MSSISTVSVISSVSSSGFEPGLAQRVADVGDDVAVLQLLDRQVHAHRTAAAPSGEQARESGGLAAGLAQHPAPDRDDQARLLGERDELVRADQAALGVLPAQQRLDARDAPSARRTIGW